MSDAYQIDGVTITPQGGGFYILTHPGLTEGVKERGKDNAEAKAAEIAKASADGTLDQLYPGNGAPADDGSMQGQGDLSSLVGTSQVPPPPPPPSEESAEAKELREMKERLAEEQAARIRAETEASQIKDQNAELKKQVETRTVTATEGEVPGSGPVPASVPRKFEGVLDDKAKATWEKLGFPMVDIVLEESEQIPPTGLFVGHNGRGYNIIAGVTVSVPEFLLGVLNDAQMSAPVVEPGSLKVLGYRNRMRYPYRRVT